MAEAKKELLREGRLEAIARMGPEIFESHAHIKKGGRGKPREIFKGYSTTLNIKIGDRIVEQEYKGIVLSDSIGNTVSVYKEDDSSRIQIHDKHLDRWYE
jgi:hypothetical protein